jgi:hypothetical protein
VEAALAAIVVNVLDETIFQAAFDEPYCVPLMWPPK